MNVPRFYKNELYTILNIEYQPLSKREIVRKIEKFIQSQGCDIYECVTIDESVKGSLNHNGVTVYENMPQEKRYINLNTPVMRALTGIYDKNEYGSMYDLSTIIYKRFKL